MVVLQLLGQGAFILASLVLGWKLLSLWRRTREVPELSIGLGFLLGGGLGYVAWFVMGFLVIQGAAAEAVHGVAALGLAFSCIGSVCNGIGVGRIYRPAARWPAVVVGVLALVMACGFGFFAVSDPASDHVGFWVALMACTPLYCWAAGEAFALARTLRKRASIGLADPVVANRVAQWGISSTAVVAMFALSLVSRLLHGPLPLPWVGTLNASFGLVAATSIWLEFFPPQRLRERLARSYGS